MPKDNKIDKFWFNNPQIQAFIEKNQRTQKLIDAATGGSELRKFYSKQSAFFKTMNDLNPTMKIMKDLEESPSLKLIKAFEKSTTLKLFQALDEPTIVKVNKAFENSFFMKSNQIAEQFQFMSMNGKNYFNDNYFKSISSALTNSDMISIAKTMQEIYPPNFNGISNDTDLDIYTDLALDISQELQIEEEVTHYFDDNGEDLSVNERRNLFYKLSAEAKVRVYYLIYISSLFLACVMTAASSASTLNSLVINLLSSIFHDKIQSILKPNQTKEEIKALIKEELSTFDSNIFKGKRVVLQETYLYTTPSSSAEIIETLSIGQILTTHDESELATSWLKVEIVRENKSITGYVLRKFSTTIKQ
ncbi:SH3 domain-containing protein [Acinetobacter baumannii]|uniref:SH3 domain-containing protein n=1 Tax=Acinetobacter baumannii TaxID=470 RepID=A0AAP1W685_ACIBA|nr:SH3 domain-containing protein [Acinetobacter baumannii]MBD2849093.1 SH3 domain-containing protein [Acinetobacter baumannii]MBD3132777.1 SH3 domain-containing protein [Acinetobacter baumannii]MBE0306572.1 SH3 domain-containing protein [Acinetobacter baumannii]MBE0311878.1 SH3 domain-containing protein [Acinetobacter baumannii]MBE0329389.1 SH3 domain-containing protein [Acinetobacter baumannii]